jgi:tetratricopeptide (TPR) repeat protein
LTDDPFVLAWLAQGYAKAGQRDEALKLLAQMEELATKRYVRAWSFAIVHLALGEKEKAIDELERSFRERSDPFITFIKVSRSLTPCGAIHGSRPSLQKLSLPGKNENKAAAGSTQCSIRSGRLQRSDRPWPLFRAILIKSGADTRRFRRIRINRLPGDANAAFRQPSSRAPLALSALSKGDQTRVRNPQFSAVGRLKSAVI